MTNFSPRYKLPMRVGRITVSKFRSAVRLRWTLNGKDYDWTIGKYSQDVLLAAIATAELINSDVAFRRFDESLAKYGKAQPKQYAEVLTMPPKEQPKELNLKEVWEMYKSLKTGGANSTKITIWGSIDKWLNECPIEFLELDNADKLFTWLRAKHSDGSIVPKMKIIKASVNLAIDLGKLTRVNLFKKLFSLLDKTKKKETKAFSLNEVKAIIQAFKDGRFDGKHSAYSSAYYANLVEFRFLTGCRPSEAIGLRWDAIKFENEKTKIIFSERYSYGEVLTGTNNGVNARIFYCNNQLAKFLKGLPRIPSKHNLVFPGIKGDYLTNDNFTRRWWFPIVHKLVELGEVKEYLPWYDERHTFGTHSARHNPDLKSLSSMMGKLSRI